MNSTQINPKLTAIIPIGGSSPNLDVISSWLTPSVLAEIKIIIVFDSLQPEISSHFRKTLAKFDSLNLTILNSDCQNPGGARNVGLSAVNTPWLAFWDADDIPQVPQILKALTESASSKSLIRGGYAQQRFSSSAISAVEENNLENDFSNLFTSGPGLWRYIFRSANVIHIRFPDLSMAEDQIFLFRALTTIGEVEEVPETFYIYQIGNPNQLTNSRRRRRDLLKAFGEMLNEFNPNDEIKYSSFETIVARMLLTSRLNLASLLRMNFQLVVTRKITFVLKAKIALRIIKLIRIYTRSR